MRSSILAATLVALLPATAFAVRPPETTHLGAEPTRMMAPDPVAQAYWSRGAAWTAFTAAEGDGWQARFDPIFGTAHRMWGPGLDLGALTSEADVYAAVTAFALDHAALLGVTDAALAPKAIYHDAARDAWLVDLDTLRDGLPIWRGGLTFRLLQGRLVMVGADAWTGAPITGAVLLDRADAMRAAVSQGYAAQAVHDRPAAELLLLPIVRGNKPELRLVWHTSSHTSAPVGQWESFVDAGTGKLLAVYNDVHFFEGQLSAEYDDRLADGGLLTGPLPYARVAGAGSSALTDATGAFSIDDADGYTLSLNGDRVKIKDTLGDITPSLTGDPAQTLTAADFDDRQAVLTSYVYLHQAQDFGRVVDPTNRWPDTKATANVNIDDVCNAFFDGSVNFFQAGSGCSNTGRLADVIFHEWGHGFHVYALATGEYDGSLGEGAADTYAFMMTDDHRLAPNFFQGGDVPLRDARNNARWPEDFTNNDIFIHENGMIFSGAMWDTRENLREKIAEPAATEVLGGLFSRMLRAGPNMETAFDEAVFADDDNADLSDGTPHQCEIVAGFGEHGLGPAGGQGIGAIHDPIVAAPSAVDTEVDVMLVNPAPACFDMHPTAGTLHWRVNGGRWETAPLQITGLDTKAAIPGGDIGDLVEYWVEAQDASGGTLYEPAGGEVRPHTFYVGDVLEVACDNFEESNGGFTHELVDGTPGDGADDWLWGKPKGAAGDPDAAFSGAKVWGNDLGGDAFNGEYQNGKQNRLTSRVYDTAHYQGTFLAYQRWLTVEDGVYDRASILADGEPVWSNFLSGVDDGSRHHLDDAWASHAVGLNGAGDDGSLQIAWDLQSDQGLAFGGWTIDDVCIYAPATPDNRLGIADLVASHDGAGPVTLSWTQPKHGPVTEVVVVRQSGGFPTGHDDGKVVWSSTDVALGAPISVEVPRGVGAGYYAVYATDGSEWLSWTREGWNAAAVGGSSTTATGGCGCDTGGSTGAWTLAAALLLGRRRRGK